MNKKSFTLLEMIIVIAIIGILAGVALPDYTKTREKAYSAEAWVNLGNLMNAAKAYYLDHSAVPPSIASLDVDNPNSIGNAKFQYSFWDGGGGNFSVYCLGKGSPVSANTGYAINCNPLAQPAETCVRQQTTDGGSTWPALP